jgi:hypothetical protein
MKGKFYMKKILLIFILLISNYGCYNSKTKKLNYIRNISENDFVTTTLIDSCSEVSKYDFSDVNQYDYFALYYDTIGFDDEIDSIRIK